MTLSESVYASKAVKQIPRAEVWDLKVGYQHAHRPPVKFNPNIRWSSRDITEAIVEEVHYGTITCFTVIEIDLLKLCIDENALGGSANPDWAWRPGLYWYYCEKCETVFWIHGEPMIKSIFPANYCPPGWILRALENRGHPLY